MIRIAAILGTRPEAVKFAPVLNALRRQPDDYRVTAVATGQQGAVFDEAVEALHIRIDRRLDVLTPGQPLWQLNARLMDALGRTFDEVAPDLVIVQGDTQTALAGAMTASLRRTPVAHVEAGLRTGNPDAPFPEEINRRAIAQLARLHFAPSHTAANHLCQEGIDRADIAVTGNTVVDTLKSFVDRAPGHLDNSLRVLVTTHRRESWDKGIDGICAAVRDLASLYPEAEILFVLPVSPALRAKVAAALGGHPRISVTDPLAYPVFLKALGQTDLMLTDSGGLQEEAGTLGIPTVVMRNETDRPEGLALPPVALAGTSRQNIVAAAQALLKRFSGTAPPASSPFGDGRAAERIVRAIGNWRAGHRPLLSPAEEFGG